MNSIRSRLWLWLIICFAVVFGMAQTTLAQADSKTEELAVARINQYRAMAGLAPMHLNQSLLDSTRGHVAYYLANGAPGSIHEEDPSKPGFVGATIGARAKHFNYVGEVDEGINTALGAASNVDAFMAMISHRLPMLEPDALDFGYAEGKNADGSRPIAVLDFGTPKRKAISTPDLIAWPPPGSSGNAATFWGEGGSPFSGVTYPLGAPITLMWRGAGQIHIVADQCRFAESTGAALDFVTGEGTTFSSRNSIALAAKKPLRQNVTYNVTLAYTLDGGAVQTRAWSFSVGGNVGLMQLPVGVAAAVAPVQALWAAVDGPVAGGSVQRTWLYGPDVRKSASEAYAESPAGQRQVYYFDKGRLELSHPDSAPTTLTAGLLVREMIMGKVQTGDNSYRPAAPAGVPLAGDDKNNPSPTYATLVALASTNNDNRAQDRTGQSIVATLDNTGTVGTRGDAGVRAFFYEPTLGHNIPDVFWNYTQSLPDNWLRVVGLPLTEAYWVRANVGGVPKDVLVQAFERRILTYTPTNTVQWRVEMGNAGLHYLHWRYGG